VFDATLNNFTEGMCKCQPTYLCISEGFIITYVLPSQISVTKTIEKQNHSRIKEVSSGCTKDTHSGLLVAKVGNSFSFVSP